MTDPIKHVVVLMFENRSFDQLLSDVPKVKDCADPGRIRMNTDTQNRPFECKPLRDKPNKIVMQDVPHDHYAGELQKTSGNRGFVQATELYDESMKVDATSDERKRQVMGYFRYGDLPVLHSLADNYTVCDNWYSSICSSTWPNRSFALAGTSDHLTTTPDDLDYQEAEETLQQWIARGQHVADYIVRSPTVFTHLLQKQVPFRVYYHDVPTTLLHADCWTPAILSRHYPMSQFYEDCQRSAADFPEVVWLEPRYGGNAPNDGHPPGSMHNCDRLVGQVYNALRGNEQLWMSTLLIVLTDENGGYFDSSLPPACIPPTNDVQHQHPIYSQLGFRVPALLISPWVNSSVDHTVYDHTSWLAYLQRKYDLPHMSNRVHTAADFRALFLPHPRRTTLLPFRSLPREVVLSNAHQVTGFQDDLRRIMELVLYDLIKLEQNTFQRWSDVVLFIRNSTPNKARQTSLWGVFRRYFTREM